MHELSESVDEVCHSSRELNNVQITQKSSLFRSEISTVIIPLQSRAIN